jgi:hypothetical protein
MSPIREEFLSLIEVEDQLRKFEEQFNFTTGEFLRNAELRATLPEDDVFQWEAFEAHRCELLRIEEEIRAAYLSNVAKSPANVRELPEAVKQCLLAA